MKKFTRIGVALFGVISILFAVGAAVDTNFEPITLVKVKAMDLLIFGVILFWIAALGHDPSERMRIWRTVQIGINFWILGLLVKYCGPFIFGTSFSLGPIEGHVIASMMGTIGLITGIIWTSLRRGSPASAAS
jgi:hypothetical protein